MKNPTTLEEKVEHRQQYVVQFANKQAQLEFDNSMHEYEQTEQKLLTIKLNSS